MITRVDAELRDDIECYALKYACEDCSHFDPQSSGCSLGFVPTPHRARTIEPGDTIVFCKTFELL
jgi:hypothetical protein